MSIVRARDITPKSAALSTVRQRIAALGTTALTVPLSAGKVYRIATDTTQSLTAAQMTFSDANGYTVGAVLRGGLAYVAAPTNLTSIIFSAGTFPMSLEFQEIEYTMSAAPTVTNASVTWGNPSQASQTFDLAFTLPAGATGIGIYWRNGTFTDLATTTSPKTGISVPTAPTFATGYPFLVAAKDANGVWGLGAEISPTYIYAFFTSNGTYATPAWSTTADVLVVAGGGGGGSNTNVGQAGGAGGAGGMRYSTSVATSGSISVTVGGGGAGGVAFAANGSNGSASSFGAAVTTVGGGGGGAASNAGATGGSGGGGGSSTGAAGSGTAGEGNNGAAGVNGSNGGGGGGKGSAASGQTGGSGTAQWGVTYAVGGQGGPVGSNTQGTTGTTAGCGGGGASSTGGVARNGSSGIAGVVIVKANGTPP